MIKSRSHKNYLFQIKKLHKQNSSFSKLFYYQKLASSHYDRKVVAISTNPNLPLPLDREPGDPVPIFSLAVSKFHPKKILACDEIGNVWFFTRKNESGLSITHSFNAHAKTPIHEIDFVGPDHSKFITVGSDSQIHLWDLSGPDSIFNFPPESLLDPDISFQNGHEMRIKAVKAIDFSHKNFLGLPKFDFVTGCSSNLIKFWDLRKPDQACLSTHLHTGGRGVTCLEFHPSSYNCQMFVGQASSKNIQILDIRYLKSDTWRDKSTGTTGEFS